MYRVKLTETCIALAHNLLILIASSSIVLICKSLWIKGLNVNVIVEFYGKSPQFTETNARVSSLFKCFEAVTIIFTEMPGFIPF